MNIPTDTKGPQGPTIDPEVQKAIKALKSLKVLLRQLKEAINDGDIISAENMINQYEADMAMSTQDTMINQETPETQDTMINQDTTRKSYIILRYGEMLCIVDDAMSSEEALAYAAVYWNNGSDEGIRAYRCDNVFVDDGDLLANMWQTSLELA